jgi:hypothetical protein
MKRQQKKKILKINKKFLNISINFFFFKEQILYDQLSTKILQLKFICEQSEVWLDNPAKMNASKINFKFVLYQVSDILKELIEVLHNYNFENKGLSAIEKLDDNDIEPVRQNMMRNLEAHRIILKLLMVYYFYLWIFLFGF